MKRIAAATLITITAATLSACAVTGQELDADIAGKWGDHVVTDEQVAAWDQATVELGYEPEVGESLTLLIIKEAVDDYCAEIDTHLSDADLDLAVQTWLVDAGRPNAEITDDMRDLVNTVFFFNLFINGEDYSDGGFLPVLDAEVTAAEAGTFSPLYGTPSFERLQASYQDAASIATDATIQLQATYAPYHNLTLFGETPEWFIEPSEDPFAVLGEDASGA